MIQSHLRAQLILVLGLFVLPLAAVGADVCASPRSSTDVLDCIETHHPDIKKIASSEELVKGVMKSAWQIPNPAITLETNSGSNLGSTVGEDTFAVSQLLEIGGKRSARVKNGRAQAEVIRSDAILLRAQTRRDALLNMIKYRQLVDEIAVIEEALLTYEKVQRQFTSRPQLSPEQQVTLGIFRLAMGDYRHRQAALESEKRVVETYFRLVPELNFEALQKILPKRLAQWPVVAEAPQDISGAPRVRVADASLRQAEALHDLANANAWPDPTVSAFTIRETDGATEFQRYGLGLTMAFPLWNLNGGERAQTMARKTQAKVEYERSMTAYSYERKNLLANYNAFVKALDKSDIAKAIDTTHRNTETFFYRGVISGVLVIEAHRQILDFTTSQHELELETVQTLSQIYFLDGRLAEFRYE